MTNRFRLAACFALLGVAAMLGGCVVYPAYPPYRYPAPYYGGGYYGGYYGGDWRR